ncbi:MAG: tryptophan synthase subunit beta [Candidatus Ratteibacteria bacterium]|jgi:tryptophan synthase beta chain
MRLPNSKGKFGYFGGTFAPETLITGLDSLEVSYRRITRTSSFKKELSEYLSTYAGRPTPLYYARNLSKKVGCKIYLKREDLAFTGSHKINNTIAQVLLANKMGKKRIIAETGAGQHGVATATAAALFKMPCEIYMGETDIARQSLNVYRMRILGATVTPVLSGSCTLKDAINEAIRDWVASFDSTHYVFGSVVGPHPYPLIVRNFQSVIGKEARRQILAAEKRLPDFLIACVGGGSNSIGLFHPFYRDSSVKFIGVEAGGKGLDTPYHSATLGLGTPGILHGSLSYLLQNKEGQVLPTHSVSAGLDYPSVGPEHSFYKDSGRALYESANDKEVLNAFHILSECEGIIPALESSHAVAWLLKNSSQFSSNTIIILSLSGRGDKDVNEVARIEENSL